MTASWGPGFDAEIAYRQEQVRAHFGSRRLFGRRRRSISNNSAPVGEQPRRAAAPVIPVQRAAADRPAPVAAPTRRAA
ncbi:MAG TPA: hypothetical protein VIU11_10350 [Nakamurella sp.]